MVILHLPPAEAGGAERQCLRQARALAARGHEVTILTLWWCARSRRHEVQDGVRIRRLGFLLPATMAARRWHARLAKWLGRAPAVAVAGDPNEVFGRPPPRRKRFRWMALAERPGLWSFLVEAAAAVRSGRLRADVIQAHESLWIAGFAQWAGEWMGAPVFCKEAFQPVLRPSAAGDVPWAEAWEGRRRRCHFVAITGGIARDLAAAGVPAERIVEIPNGVELPAEAVDPGRRSDALYVGNFTQGSAHKGFDILFQAWARAVRREPAMKLRLFGRGELGFWKRYAAEQGCGESAVFEGATPDVWGAHRQGGYLVLPSRTEGLSNALLEAMASGLPAVVSAIPGNVAVVEDGVNGLVVPVGDVDALAEALLRLHRSAPLRAELGRAARTRIAETYEIGRIAARLETAYGQALAADRAAPRRAGFGG